MKLRRCSLLVIATVFLSLLLVSTATAELVQYQFSGDATVYDKNDVLGGGSSPYILAFSGGFAVETDGDSPYATTDFSLSIGDYTFSDPEGGVHWSQDQDEDDARIGGDELSSSLEETLAGYSYNFEVWFFAYGVSPGDNSGYTHGRMQFKANQAGPNTPGFNMIGSFDTFDIVPVPLPAAIWLLGSGFCGLAAIRKTLA